MGAQALGSGVESYRKGIVAVDLFAFSLLSHQVLATQCLASRCRESTYQEVANIRHEAGREYIEQTVDAELPDLREVDEIVRFCEEASGHETEYTAEEEDERVPTFSRLGLVDVFDDMNMLYRLARRLALVL